jgi:predicted phage terminase large subunit-like protein
MRRWMRQRGSPLPMADIPKRVDPRAQLLDLDRVDCEESMYEFLRHGWRYMDPSPFAEGWHLQAICEHLEAVVYGDIKRLVINVPPRSGKSLITSVAFPAWTWAQQHRSHTCGPGVPFLYASYGDDLSRRDSVRCRRLIESEWYQKLWGNRFELASDQNTKGRFTNDQGGERLITSIGGRVTGEGGNIIVIDDPNAANEMESEATLETTLDWWRISMPTRPNDQELSAIVIIQQRLAQNDLTGHIQEFEADGWDFLVLPGRYEKWRASHTTSIGWSDPRTEEGELLWPAKVGEAALTRLETRMGKFVFAGQIQQRPSPKGGGIIERDWWVLWDKEDYPPFDYICAMVDTAYTAETYNDASAMIVWGVFTPPSVQRVTRIVGLSDGVGGRQSRPTWESVATNRAYSGVTPRAMLMYAWRERLEFHNLVEKVAATARQFKCELVMIENKAAGISIAQEIRRLYFNERFGLQMFDPKSQDKTARLYSVQSLFQESLVFAPDRPWAEMVIEEVALFNPSRKNNKDDLTDCVSMGMRHLRDSGMLARTEEIEVESEALKRYQGRQMPLYPV